MKHEELVTKILSITTRNTALLLLAYMADIPLNIIYTHNDNSIITIFSIIQQAELTNKLEKLSKVVDFIISKKIDN
jgi:hypothetical protein